ncbi:hypothetical protein K474DRAFT_1627295 [Panus rudis PR-1116 ss-1]|nr:hypothetical protein K474DRAFT_1627295 [Panus rudis PR-1116 ss-1]
MAAVNSHRPSASVTNPNLAPPGGAPRQRRMTSPNLPPPPSPLNLPEPVYGHRRPPSPLRNGFTADPETGEGSEDGSDDSEDERQWGEGPGSPSPSVAQFAANIAQKMGTLMSNMSQRSSTHLPTDEELEAEAERERERSRREAERILNREAEAKRLEQRVLEMIESRQGSPRELPPPPPLSDRTPGTPPSPSNSQKERWWAIAKAKLTPTKEPLTPAQQVIQETKQREKELEKERKELEKEKKEAEKEMKKHAKKHEKNKSAQWPASPEDKYQDPAFLKLHTAAAAQNHPQPPQPSRAMTSSPASPTPVRRGSPSIPPSLAPSPMRLNESGSVSPSRQSTPLYAQFNAQGTLDIPATLITIAQRFEKLEKWTVSHVRALEERMDDVERWLVDKEQEKEATKDVARQQTGDLPPADALNELREELAEVQGRIGELGREMAKMVTAPGNLNTGPSRTPASLGRAPSTSSSIAVRSISSQMNAPTPRGSTPPKKEPTSPPITTPPAPSRTRLPYPTGDYATPPDSVILSQGPFSPPNSPPSNPTRPRQSISGLPSQDLSSSLTASPSGLPRTESPGRVSSPPAALSPPGGSSRRQSSVSPTPRKRYTVALGDSIMGSSERERQKNEQDRPMTPHSRNQSRELGTAYFSTSPLSLEPDETSDDEDGANEETIGKAAARHAGLGLSAPAPLQTRRNSTSPISSPAASPPQRRARPQSMYNGPTSSNILAPTPTTPLHSRMRSQSQDRAAIGVIDSLSTLSGGRFVDPLIIRKQTKDAMASAAPPPPKVLPGKPKVPVGQLVAYFDKERA